MKAVNLAMNLLCVYVCVYIYIYIFLQCNSKNNFLKYVNTYIRVLLWFPTISTYSLSLSTYFWNLLWVIQNNVNTFMDVLCFFFFFFFFFFFNKSTKQLYQKEKLDKIFFFQTEILNYPIHTIKKKVYILKEKF